MSIVRNRKKNEGKKIFPEPRELPCFIKIRFSKNMAHFQFKDGRLVSVPLNDIEFLKRMKPADRKNYKIEGSAAFWDSVNEGISARHLLTGNYW